MKKKENLDDETEEKKGRRKKRPRRLKPILIQVTILAIIIVIFYYILFPWMGVSNINFPMPSIPGVKVPSIGIGDIVNAVIFICVILFIIWLILGFRAGIVGPDEQGNKIFFGSMGKYNYPIITQRVDEQGNKVVDKQGNPVLGVDNTNSPHGLKKLIYGYCDSGIHFVLLLPYCGIAKIPKKRFEIDYDKKVVYSKQGDDTNNNRYSKYGKQVLLVESFMYLHFGNDYNSVKNVIAKKIPLTEEGLKAYTDGMVDDAVGTSIGGMTWGEATEDTGRERIKKALEEKFKDENKKLEVFDERKITAGINTVDLQDEKLKKSIATYDQERYDAETSVFEAQRTRIATVVLADIRKALEKEGFAKENVDQIAHNIYELQTASDLQKESKTSVVKLIRWQGDSSIPGGIAQIMTAAEIGREIQSDKTKTNLERAEKEKIPEEKDRDRAREILKKRGINLNH